MSDTERRPIDEIEESFLDDEQVASPEERKRLFDERPSHNPYSITLNGKKYALNEELRRSIQDRAEKEFEENDSFSCWWKVASPDQYDDDRWEQHIHDAGDPVLVIETTGRIVPWDRLDQLQVEMQEVGPQSQLDSQMDDADTDPNEKDNGNGLKTIDPDDVDESEKEIGRTHFPMTPKQFEEVPDPDGEDPHKIPPKPVQMDDEPAMIKWIPDHPDIDHSWSTGEAITAVHTRVEWNVQKRADQPQLAEEKDTSHDHWESILSIYDCPVVAELQPSQKPQASSKQSDVSDSDEVPKRFEEGTAGGGHWRV